MRAARGFIWPNRAGAPIYSYPGRGAMISKGGCHVWPYPARLGVLSGMRCGDMVALNGSAHWPTRPKKRLIICCEGTWKQ